MKKILMIDDDKVSLSTAKGVLANEYKMISVLDGTQGLKFLENNECDLILLDINMPGMNGFEVLEQIRKQEKNVNIPVIFLTSDNDADTETKCFESGAMDFISKPFVPSVIKSRVNRTIELEEYRAALAKELHEKKQEVDEIKTKSFTDALTGLWNREFTEKKVNEILSTGANGCLFMVDLDNFKTINDNYGHQEGDRVLNMFADTLREYSGENDVICRIGGDEFVAFMYEKTKRPEIANLAGDIIRSLNQRIKEMNYDVNTSVSIGISISGVDADDFAKLYNCGDKALYYVKNNGKNSFRFFSDNVLDEKKRVSRNVDLAYLGEILSRSDSGHGAYMLDFENFNHIYNFIKRFVERNSNEVVSVLFQAESLEEKGMEEEVSRALEMLDQAIYTSLRRVDISTRYSSIQTMVILLDTNIEFAEKVVRRILDCFHKLYLGDAVTVTYSLAEIKSKNNKNR